MDSLMEEKIAETFNSYHYLISTSWKHMLSVLLLQEPDNSQKPISYTLKIENSKIELQSNLYNTTTLETTQKRLSWTGGCLIKHLHKTTTCQTVSRVFPPEWMFYSE